VAVLVASDATCLEPAAILARELNLPLIDSPSADYDLLLAWTGRRLELRDNRDPRIGPVVADFVSLSRQRRLTARDPLVRAVGKQARFVVDATLGLGTDAFLLARYGYEVLGIERQPVVAALVQDALARAGAPPNLRVQIGEGANGASLHRAPRLHPVGDARAILPTLDPAPDVVYLDPMFPPKRRRSAAVGKEMRLLRWLAGEDADAHELFEVARRVARQRVVVKRPDHAAPLAPKPTVSYGGKLVRYDVYRVEMKRTT
jgi:16S rRNA (guanine1516-N2)-methyltransferase